jgi:hypothetical protein
MGEHERYPDIAVTLAIKDGEDADSYEERAVRQALARVRSRGAQEEP